MKSISFHIHRDTDSFTLVELLVVIGILAILTAAVVIVLNPAELLKQSRDSKRTADLANLNNAIKLLLTQNPDVNLGAASTVYLSLSDSSSTCGSYSLPTLPTGWRYSCVTAANLNKVDGSGWVPINFSSTGGVASLSALPIDPQNTGIYYYSYIPGGSWEIMGLFESRKYAAKAQSDAGIDPERLEVGSNLALWKDAYGLVGYWPFEEGSGSITYDKSGNGNTGTLTNNSAWISGKIGTALSFSDPREASIPDNSTLDVNNTSFSISLWALTNDISGVAGIISKAPNVNAGYSNYALWKSSNRFVFYIGTNAISQYDAIGSTTLTQGKWYHVAATYEASSQTMKIYTDGILNASKTSSVTPVANDGAIVFGSLGGLNYLNGALDDIRIYNRALSAAEIQAIYNATK